VVWPLRVRGRLLVAALVLIAAIGVAIGLWFTRYTGTDAAALASYFPSRSAATVYLDVAAMRSSGILDKLVGSTVGEEREYRDFVQGTGFDYKRDLNQVALNSAGGVHYFVLEGRFDWDKLESYAKAQGGQCGSDGCHVQGSTPDRIVSFRRLRKNLMAMASAKDQSAAKAIDRRTQEQTGYSVPNAPLWAHVPVELVRSMPSYPSGTRLFAKALESADSALFTLTPAADGFQLAADVACRTQEDAAILKAQLEGITGLLQKFLRLEKQKASAADLSGILSAGSFERSGTHVKARWPVPRAFLDALTKT
jgi:hypothetical protein